MARVRRAWEKFREFLPIVTGKGFSLKLKGKAYTSRVRSCSFYGSETWPMKVNMNSWTLNEMSMLRCMCGFSLKDSKN